jgi:pyruvate kinase
MLTQILATLGPATLNRISDLYHAGLSGIRINSSHGSMDEHLEMIEKTRATSDDLFIVYDIKGPKIRLGDFPDSIPLTAGDRLVLRTDIHKDKDSEYPRVDDPKAGIPITFPNLIKTIQPGHRLFVDDGYIGLKVESLTENKVICQVMYGDRLRPRKGLNHPDTQIDYPYTMQSDIPYIEFAKKHNVDFIADSFTRDGDDVRELRHRLSDTRIKIISKIENPEGLDNFDEILKETDAIMIARGDLGVEVDPWRLPELQKEMITECNRAAKPVITATQMLESMINNPRPSRADVSDVANALYDGTDVVMLSGETAIGDYPVQCVNWMCQINEFVEQTKRYKTKKQHSHTLQRNH